MPKRPTMQGWQDRCKEMQYSRRKPCSLVEALGITFKAIGVPADHPYCGYYYRCSCTSLSHLKKWRITNMYDHLGGTVWLWGTPQRFSNSKPPGLKPALWQLCSAFCFLLLCLHRPGHCSTLVQFFSLLGFKVPIIFISGSTCLLFTVCSIKVLPSLLLVLNLFPIVNFVSYKLHSNLESYFCLETWMFAHFQAPHNNMTAQLQRKCII